MVIDSTKTDPDALEDLEDILYGTENANARLPLPAEVISIVGGSAVTYVYTAVSPVGSENPVTEGWYVRLGNEFIKSTDTSVITGTVYFERTAE